MRMDPSWVKLYQVETEGGKRIEPLYYAGKGSLCGHAGWVALRREDLLITYLLLLYYFTCFYMGVTLEYVLGSGKTGSGLG